MNFIDTMSETVEETEDYYIVTLNNGKFNTIEDIDGKNLHVFSTTEEYEDVKTDISSKVNVNYKEDDSLIKLANDIIEFKSYVALISASQYEMIKDDITDFDAKIKIIYTSSHKIGSTTQHLIEKNSKLKIEDGIFNIYISGIDTSGKISNVSRSDANILATVNTKTNEVLLTSIPRDYYVTLHSKQSKDKLTHSGVYGINETVTTVEDLLDTEINYYVRVNFTTLIKLVDTLGGIDVYSDVAFTTKEGYSFTKGNNNLNGKEALAFSRERRSFKDGDRQRVKNQQKVLEAIMKKVLNSKTLLTKYTDILNSLSGSFQTNIEQGDISVLVKGQLDNMKTWNISMNSLDGTGANEITYSAGSQKLYVMLPDRESVSTGKAKIYRILGM
jgi:LCP family protein required for cell wall assembly